MFYRQGGICIAPLPPENWWLIVYIVYSTIPILLLMAMIMATFTFAMRFAKRQRRSVRAPSSVSHTGGNYHTSVGRTASAPEMDSHGPGQGVSKAMTEKTGKREQIKLCCCCFCEFKLHNIKKFQKKNYLILLSNYTVLHIKFHFSCNIGLCYSQYALGMNVLCRLKFMWADCFTNRPLMENFVKFLKWVPTLVTLCIL